MSALVLLAGCHRDAPIADATPIGKTALVEPKAEVTDVAASLASDGSDGNWPGYGRGFDSTHYSPLAEINESNADKLGLAWALDLPVGNSHSAPLAVDGVIYFSQGFAVIHAVEALTGKLKWKYDPKVTEVAGDKLRAAWGTRGIGFWNGKVYTGTQDGRLLAINAKDGTLAWSVDTTIGKDDGRYITGAPLLFDGKVLVGHGGADFAAVRGYVTAYDAETGKKLWRFYTVPGDPKTGPEDEASDDVMAMAAKTWNGQWWKYGGGGTAWNALAYDAELDRIYIGTGNGAPWNQAIRSPGGGDNFFLCSILALEAKTGKYIWHYQVNPGETWDFNAAMDIELATLDIAGKPTKALLHAPKNGFFYVIDRETGKLVSAIQWAKQNWAKEVDPQGRPVELPDARPPQDGKALVTPGGSGAHNWMPMSFSPKTGLVYIPRQDGLSAYTTQGIDRETWKADARISLNHGYMVSDTRRVPPASTTPRGALVAWNPLAGKEAWSVPMIAPVNGGTLTTGGDLVFQGNAEGKFIAYAANTGKVLWSFDAHNGIVGQPITFTAGGKQYVSILTGYGAIGAVSGPTAARFNWQYRQQHRRLLTFMLGGTAKLPENETIAPITVLDDPKLQLDEDKVARGSIEFGKRCLLCHGAGAVAGGAAPDLRASAIVLDADSFKAVLQGGSLEQVGMPKYDELSDEQLELIRLFIRFRAREALKEQHGTEGDGLKRSP